MRRSGLVLLLLSLAVSACSSTPPVSLFVTCGGSTALAGAASIDVLVDPVAKSTVLSFPDPVNAGHTGTIAVTSRCTITPKG
jgi:hypothetical protein